MRPNQQLWCFIHGSRSSRFEGEEEKRGKAEDQHPGLLWEGNFLPEEHTEHTPNLPELWTGREKTNLNCQGVVCYQKSKGKPSQKCLLAVSGMPPELQEERPSQHGGTIPIPPEHSLPWLPANSQREFGQEQQQGRLGALYLLFLLCSGSLSVIPSCPNIICKAPVCCGHPAFCYSVPHKEKGGNPEIQFHPTLAAARRKRSFTDLFPPRRLD